MGVLGVIHDDEVQICEPRSQFVRGYRDAVQIECGKEQNRFVWFEEVNLESRSTLTIDDRIELVLFIRV